MPTQDRSTLVLDIAGADREPRVRRRHGPNDVGLELRAERLRDISDRNPTAPLPAAPLLELGNTKLGGSGRLFGSVWVWNLPAMTTCPGRSPWCAASCYNGDPRSDVFPIDAWRANLTAVEGAPEETAAKVLSLLEAAPKPVAVRLHSSGDFCSESYIDWWAGLISQTPKVRYWAYTRSWAVAGLMPRLESLRALPNMQLFASWDHTMPRPPEGWRLSIISNGNGVSTKVNLDCPEQYEGGPRCADCGYCITKRRGNVIFHPH
jgi:hypothetical protein